MHLHSKRGTHYLIAGVITAICLFLFEIAWLNLRDPNRITGVFEIGGGMHITNDESLEYLPIESPQELEEFLHSQVLSKNEVTAQSNCTVSGKMLTPQKPVVEAVCSGQSEISIKRSLHNIEKAIIERHETMMSLEQEKVNRTFKTRNDSLKRMEWRIKRLETTLEKSTEAFEVTTLIDRLNDLEAARIKILNKLEITEFYYLHHNQTRLNNDTLKIENRIPNLQTWIVSVFLALITGCVTTCVLMFGGNTLVFNEASYNASQ